MSKVFEALQRAEREQSRALPEVERQETRREDSEDRELESPFSEVTGPEQKPTDGRISPWLVTHWNLDSTTVEQIKRIRTHICHCTQSPCAPRTIMVTSSIAGEGKSLLMANLGIGIAHGLHEHVILVDSDLRNSNLHSYFGKPKSPGLSDCLRGGLELQEIIRPTGIPKVSLIPAGRKTENPIELLSSKKMRELVSELKERYEDRFVLFDSTPVLLTNEPVVLSKMMDGILLVVRHNMSSREAVKEAIDLLTKERIIGLIFNDSPNHLSRLNGYAYK